MTDFDPSKVSFRIGDNFGKHCLIAEYGFYSSVAIEIDKDQTLESLKQEFPAMIADIKEDFDKISST